MRLPCNSLGAIPVAAAPVAMDLDLPEGCIARQRPMHAAKRSNKRGIAS
jgi:hypothetical protein